MRPQEFGFLWRRPLPLVREGGGRRSEPPGIERWSRPWRKGGEQRPGNGTLFLSPREQPNCSADSSRHDEGAGGGQAERGRGGGGAEEGAGGGAGRGA